MLIHCCRRERPRPRPRLRLRVQYIYHIAFSHISLSVTSLTWSKPGWKLPWGVPYMTLKYGDLGFLSRSLKVGQ